MTISAVRIPTQIVKRNGLIVEFNASKLFSAIEKCFISIGDPKNVTDISELVNRACNVAAIRHETPTVEQVQDIVEFVLQSSGEYNAAKAYILYRAQRTSIRLENEIPQNVIDAFAEDDKYFPTLLQRFQFLDKYSRWNEELGRRETWVETVRRAVDFLRELSQNKLSESIYDELFNGILNMEVMPSMRLLAMAGPAARRDNAVIYNCSYLPIDSINSFVDIMSNSMAGCGVGFSVEFANIDQLPHVKEQNGEIFLKTIGDSAEGWCDALRYAMHGWFAGYDVDFDYSDLRPKGAILKTKGGRASGPEPLRILLSFIRDRILARQGRKLTSLDCHDIACAIGNAVVSGGVRRTAMISLFDESDNEMLHCKDGDLSKDNDQRWNANNSMVWTTSDIAQMEFMKRFYTMLASERGEPGIFNRGVTIKTMPARRDISNWKFGTNPCAEIILRPRQFCNLSIIVARPDDTLESLCKKARLATIIGTIQSMATNFPNLDDQWRQNCEEERLLGVDINGQQDCRVLLANPYVVFDTLKKVCLQTNTDFAQELGINRSAAITCVKPNGNSSTLLNCAAGLHTRWAPYYIRNVRVSAYSPLAKVLLDAKFPMEPENNDDPLDPKTWVASFPVKSPANSITRDDSDAIEQCEWWLINKTIWTEHNPSVTITYRPEEALDLTKWVWDNRELIGGMAFLPRSDAKYDQLPYIEITKEEYDRRMADLPQVNFANIFKYEKEDRTTAAQELACVTGYCETS